jgi:hypothetical protein
VNHEKALVIPRESHRGAASAVWFAHFPNMFAGDCG